MDPLLESTLVLQNTFSGGIWTLETLLNIHSQKGLGALGAKLIRQLISDWSGMIGVCIFHIAIVHVESFLRLIKFQTSQ